MTHLEAVGWITLILSGFTALFFAAEAFSEWTLVSWKDVRVRWWHYASLAAAIVIVGVSYFQTNLNGMIVGIAWTWYIIALRIGSRCTYVRRGQLLALFRHDTLIALKQPGLRIIPFRATFARLYRAREREIVRIATREYSSGAVQLTVVATVRTISTLDFAAVALLGGRGLTEHVRGIVSEVLSVVLKNLSDPLPEYHQLSTLVEEGVNSALRAQLGPVIDTLTVDLVRRTTIEDTTTARERGTTRLQTLRTEWA